MQHFRDTISKQRDGYEVENWELSDFVRGIVANDVTDSQIAAFTMAVYLRGMTSNEIVTLTKTMKDSGKVFTWDLSGPVMDKHSTGGIGDLTSLILVPMFAAMGGFVPMVSNRGLAHTGGTLDKLSSIPGYNINPSSEEFEKVVKKIGCAIIGKPADLNPADKRISTIRNEVGTVESEGLIVSSIISKKAAMGIDNLVLDIKTGNGAFMKNYTTSKKLATKLAGVAKELGMNVSACITDMNQPLAYSAGNALEVREAIDFMTGVKKNSRLSEVVMKLANELVVHSKLAKDVMSAESLIDKSLDSGAAAEKFGEMIAALGGPTDLVENPDKHLPKAKIIEPVYPDKKGYIHAINAKSYGKSLIRLGGARQSPDEKINYAVGLENIASISSEVGPDQRPLCLVHADTQEEWEAAAKRIRAATVIETLPVSASQAVLDTIKPSRY